MVLKDGIRKAAILSLVDALESIRPLSEGANLLGLTSMSEELERAYRSICDAKDKLEYGV